MSLRQVTDDELLIFMSGLLLGSGIGGLIIFLLVSVLYS